MNELNATDSRPVSIPHLVMGLIFVGLFAIWALLTSGIADTEALRWLIPLPLVVAGIAGLIAAARGNRP